MKPRLTIRVKKQYDAIVSGAPWGKGWGWDDERRAWIDRRYQTHCWGALSFSRRWAGRSGFNLRKLQLIVLRSGDAECAYEYARDVPGAQVRRLQKVVVDHGDATLMRKFSKLSGADVQLLRSLVVVAEAMTI